MTQTPLEAAKKHETRCDIIYESFMNGQNKQFMEQITEYKVDVGLLINFVKNYYGEIQSNEVARRYAVLAQAQIERPRW